MYSRNLEVCTGKILKERTSAIDISSLCLPAYSLYSMAVQADSDGQICTAADARRAAILSRFFTQAIAVSGIETIPVIIDGRVAGHCYEDDYARWCWLSDVLPQNKNSGREEQACSVFQSMKEALNQCGMQFQDVVRTWFFLDDILDWYAGFNRVRTDFFNKNIAMEKFLPASTGVGTANSAGAALIASAVAVKPKTESFTVQTVPSPQQSPASNYKSSFSRAVEITCPTHRLLHISGTASINSEGISVHRGDAARQIEFTMQVIDALLKSRGMDWGDSFRGIAYFKDMKEEALFRSYCRERQMPGFPLSATCATICREELLFEIELDAAKIAD